MDVVILVIYHLHVEKDKAVDIVEAHFQLIPQYLNKNKI